MKLSIYLEHFIIDNSKNSLWTSSRHLNKQFEPYWFLWRLTFLVKFCSICAAKFVVFDIYCTSRQDPLYNSLSCAPRLVNSSVELAPRGDFLHQWCHHLWFIISRIVQRAISNTGHYHNITWSRKSSPYMSMFADHTQSNYPKVTNQKKTRLVKNCIWSYWIYSFTGL